MKFGAPWTGGGDEKDIQAFAKKQTFVTNFVSTALPNWQSIGTGLWQAGIWPMPKHSALSSARGSCLPPAAGAADPAIAAHRVWTSAPRAISASNCCAPVALAGPPSPRSPPPSARCSTSSRGPRRCSG
jgi:hypothetical protein